MTLDMEAIRSCLPHRYPFLLVDRVLEVIPGQSAVGMKNVTINEPYFQGHFPDYAIMPGVLIIEALAQLGGIYAMQSDAIPEGHVTYFTGIDKARFRRPVVPGDQLRLEVEILRCRRGLYCFAGSATVEGEMAAQAELKATFAPRENPSLD